jgi:hypothetical protein
VVTAALFVVSEQKTSPRLRAFATMAVVGLAIYNILEVALYRVVWV